jgi:hypothetical protein
VVSELDDLLARLEAVPVRGVTYVGQAVGKDDEHLHLAVREGVIAIPIAAIAEVRTYPFTPVPNVVALDVPDTSGVTQIRRVTPVPGESSDEVPGNALLSAEERFAGLHSTRTPASEPTATAVVEDGFGLLGDDFDPFSRIDDVAE